MKGMRKVICVIVATTMLLSAGCTAKRKVTLNKIKYVSENAPWYNTTRLNYSDLDIDTDDVMLRSLVVHENAFAVSLDARTWGNSTYEESLTICQSTYDGTILSLIDVTSQLGSDDVRLNIIDSYSIDDEDYYLICVQSYEDYSLKYMLYKADYTATSLVLVQEITLPSQLIGVNTICDIQVTEDYLIYFLLDAELNYYAYVISLSDGSESIHHLTVGQDEYMHIYWRNTDLAVGANNSVYLFVERANDYAIYSLDPASGAFIEIRSLNMEDYSPRFINNDGSYLYNDDGKIVKADIVTGVPIETIIDMNYSALSPSSYNDSLVGCYEGNIIIAGNNGVVILNQAPNNPHAGKQIVSVAYLGNIDKAIDYMFETNNASTDSQYYVELNYNYNAYKLLDGGQLNSIYEAYVIVNDRLIRDINNGSGPDIVMGGASCCSAAPELIYADLSSLIEGDSGINEDEYLNVLFDTDGSIYNLPYAVNLNGIAVDQEIDVSGGLDFDVYIDLINQYHRGRDLFNDYSDMEYFESIFSICESDFVSAGRFNITSGDAADEFRNIAEFVANREDNFEATSDSTNSHMNLLNSYDFVSYLFELNAETRVVTGIPLYRSAGAYTNVDLTVSITGCCADKDAAWSIVRQLFTYDAQITLDGFTPVHIAALNSLIDADIETIENGAIYYDWYTPDIDLNSNKAAFIESVQSITCVANADPKILQIMYEELPAYFEGQKTLDDVAQVIENRVNIYLEEVK